MVIRRIVFNKVGGSREGSGKLNNRACPEDAHLCRRAVSTRDRGTRIYDPAVTVGRRVPARRATFGFFLSRCFDEGSGKGRWLP